MPFQLLVLGVQYPFQIEPCMTLSWGKLGIGQDWVFGIVRANLLTLIAPKHPTSHLFSESHGNVSTVFDGQIGYTQPGVQLSGTCKCVRRTNIQTPLATSAMVTKWAIRW
jgi:hypothetical protein